MTPPKVPTRKPTPEQCFAELELVFERVMYVIQWIANTPNDLVDGQHHEVLREAIAELGKRIQKAADDNPVDKEGGVWNRVLSRAPKSKRAPNSRGPGSLLAEQLEEHGLTGAQWVLKFEAFDRHFRGVLDRIALLERRYEGVARQVDALGALVDLRPAADGALEMGATIFDSAAEALSEVPGAKVVIGLAKEGVGAVRALIKK